MRSTIARRKRKRRPKLSTNKHFIFFFFFLHILIENNQKAFQPLTLMCDHHQYSRKVKKPEERQVHSERKKYK